MELWTYINKKTKEIIKAELLDSDPEFGNLYYFVDDSEYSPYWFVDTKEKAEIAFIDFVHPVYNSYSRPDTEKINMSEYKLIKFEKK